MNTNLLGKKKFIIAVATCNSAVHSYYLETRNSDKQTEINISEFLTFVWLLSLKWEKWPNSDKNCKLVTLTSFVCHAINNVTLFMISSHLIFQVTDNWIRECHSGEVIIMTYNDLMQEKNSPFLALRWFCTILWWICFYSVLMIQLP